MIDDLTMVREFLKELDLDFPGEAFAALDRIEQDYKTMERLYEEKSQEYERMYWELKRLVEAMRNADKVLTGTWDGEGDWGVKASAILRDALASREQDT